MAYNNQEKDTRPRAPFDLFDLTLWAPSTAQGKSASFNLDVDVANRVSFIVRTGDPADKEKSKDGDVIRMKVKLAKFKEFIALFGQVVRSKGEIKYAMVEQVYFRFNKETKQRERMDKPRDGNELFFGKDRDGVIFISLVAYNKTKIEFRFVPDRKDFVFKHADGNVFTAAEDSASAAGAYHALCQELIDRVDQSRLVHKASPDLYKPPYVPQQGGHGGGGNSYNKGGSGGSNSGGGSSNSSGNRVAANDADDMMDDDIPY